MTMRQIIHGPKINLLVLSLNLAEQMTLDHPYVVISITNTSAGQANLAASDNLLDALRIKFDDISRPVEGFVEPQPEHGQKIIDFVEKWKDKAQTIVVHCEAGRSRSAGVAAGLSKVYNGDDMIFYRYYTPNNRAYTVVTNAAHEKGLV